MVPKYGVTGRGGRRAGSALGVGAVALALAAAVPAGAANAATTSHLLGISVQSYSTYDRVILDVSSIPGYTVTPTDELTGQGSGKDITLPDSNTYLDVELSPSDTTGYSGPTRVTTGFPEVTAVAQLGSFEGDTQVGIGLNHSSSFTVSVLSPTELAIDVAH